VLFGGNSPITRFINNGAFQQLNYGLSPCLIPSKQIFKAGLPVVFYGILLLTLNQSTVNS